VNFPTCTSGFDGVPLDLNLTLPPTSMNGPFPLIVELHGWSLSKSANPLMARANAGYAVLSYTARGFHTSCGSEAFRVPDPSLTNPNVCTERGWIRRPPVAARARMARACSRPSPD
jgi:cephalosporin-C deacetylase-like acetyl esterase